MASNVHGLETTGADSENWNLAGAVLADESFSKQLGEAVNRVDRAFVKLLVEEGRKTITKETYIEALTKQLAVTVENNSPGDYVLRLLLQAGAQIDAQAGNGQTVLFFACTSDKKDSVKELLKYKPDLGLVVNDETCLSIAVSRGCSGIAMMLLDAGTNPYHHTTREANRYLLHECVKHNLEGVLRSLLLYNIQIEEIDSLGRTALNCITSATGAPIFELLINRGASVNTVNRDENTPLS
ncbi:ankyrin [Mytilinidion resinicola]|uniref:Ankyrin n=1 Tax=Mytilinidion resinicola TaxID=574789 RepID=A0A6A6Y376_9PEZI|nr:ankyrin [Mytilinidion resinicola]KAF2802237.1 ankyrin [Mytilinidion resinicola]